MLENDCVALIEKMDETQLKTQLLGPFSLITDRLGQELIKKAAESNSPLDVQDIHTTQFYSRYDAIMRLFELEQLSIFTSAFETRNGRTTRTFTITDNGRKTILT